jgi:hypothetical protein
LAHDEDTTLKIGTKVILTELPAGLLDGLPFDDQQAIKVVVGKPVLLAGYDESGRAELEFTDQKGVIHFIYADPTLVIASDSYC